MNNIIEFKKRTKDTAPKSVNYVMVCIDSDGGNAFLEHSDRLNGYEVLGMLQFGASLKLAETQEEKP